MDRIPNTAPIIAPLSENVARVKWAVMIPVFNCSQYLSETLKSVLQQDPGAEVMQIEVVDDCSNDANVEELVKQIGNGRITYFKQSENVGSLRNFETCINRSRGTYVHLLHGDDRVKDGFYKTMDSLFRVYPAADAAFCAWDYINENGEFLRTSKKESNQDGLLENCFHTITMGQMTQYVSTVVKRHVYEKLGSFYAVTYGEDWIMWARIAKEYKFAYTPEALADYREHSTSISGQSRVNGEDIRDIKKVSAIISSLMPANKRRTAAEVICKNYAYWSLEQLYKLWFETDDITLITKHLKQQLKGYKDIKVIALMSKLWFLTIKWRINKMLGI